MHVYVAVSVPAQSLPRRIAVPSRLQKWNRYQARGTRALCLGTKGLGVVPDGGQAMETEPGVMHERRQQVADDTARSQKGLCGPDNT